MCTVVLLPTLQGGSFSTSHYPISLSLLPTSSPPPFLHSLQKMAAWGSLKNNIFQNPMPDSSSPWENLEPLASSASLEMFGELYHPFSSSSSSSPLLDRPLPPPPLRCPCLNAMSEPNDTGALEIFGELCYTEKPDFSASAERLDEERFGYMRSQSTRERSEIDKMKMKEVGEYKRSYSDVRQRISSAASASSAGGQGVAEFPPPITTIGSGGKPRVYFKSFRKDGRFVLREIRIPTQRLLQAKRENGRLTMRVMRLKDEEEETKEGGKEEGGDLKND